MSKKTQRQISFGEVLFVFLFLIVSLMSTIILFGGDPHIPILVTTIIASIVAIRAGYKWNDIQDGIIDGIKMSMQAILILMIVGMLIGVWILAGVVPTMIYYGLKILSPGIFLVAT
ncbi:MAG: sodium:proton antiporter, partial [Firmicutes bacterium]|nr:sodium:proton antiporter [Bacillota bacterium]